LEKPKDQDSAEKKLEAELTDSEFGEAEATEPTQNTSSKVATRMELRRRKRRKRAIRLSALGATVLALAGSGAYLAFGTADVPAASSSNSELSKSDPCEEFSSLTAECTVSFDYSDSVDRDGLISQSVPAGFSFTQPEAIELVYSSGPAESEFPDILRQDYEDAVEELYPIGVELGEVTTVQRDDLGPNRIVSSSIEPGTVAKSGSKVNLEVSAETVVLPELNGLSREQAELDLQRLGFDTEILEENSTSAPGTVVGQEPASGAVAKGSQVLVKIAKAEEIQTLKVPSVVGLSEIDAQSIIASAGFTNIAVVRVESSKVTEPLVTHVAPGVDRMVRSDSNVVLVVSIPEL